MGEFDEVHAVGIADDGNHEAVLGVGGDAEVDCGVLEDFFACVVDDGVHGAKLGGECSRDGGADEGQEAELDAGLGGEVFADGVDHGDICIIHDGEVDGGVD